MSSQPRPRAWHRITSEAAAAYLAVDEGRYFLRPFLERESSVAQAAELLGEPLDRTHYRVKRMLQLGILEVTREEARAGRPVKYYRSVGDGLFVPFSLTSAADLEESRRRTNAELDARLVHAQTVAMRELTDARGPEMTAFGTLRDAALTAADTAEAGRCLERIAASWAER